MRDIRRRTRRKYSAEEKIRIVLEGLRGEESIAELCRKEGLNPNVYYRWSKEFMEAGKKRLSGDTVREATSDDYHVVNPWFSQFLFFAVHRFQALYIYKSIPNLLPAFTILNKNDLNNKK